MLVLLTNDDGIFAKGLRKLKDGLEKICDVFVVAPDKEKSTSSHSLTLTHPLRFKNISSTEISVDGTPTDCVILAVRGILKRRPDIIVSGINHGPNLGDDVLYSGTVAAAMEGTLLGIKSVAVSLVSEHRFDFSASAKFAAALVQRICKIGLPPETFLNVNIPDGEKLEGIKITKLGKRIYKDYAEERVDHNGKPYFWIDGELEWEKGKNTDFDAIEKGLVSITPLHLDLTNHKAIKRIKRWEKDFQKKF